MKKILLLLFLWISILDHPAANAQEDTVMCRMTIQNTVYRECIIKDSLIIKILDEMLVNLEEEPEGGVYYPYSKSLIFMPEKPSHKIILTSSPNYTYQPLDESSQFYFEKGFMYAFQYKGFYFGMLLDLEKDSFHKEMFYHYFELTGNSITVPYYQFFKGDAHCLLVDKFDQTFAFYINEGRIYGKEFLKEWFWPWD